MLNDQERQNLDVIRDAEASKHETVQPGDMRFYRNRLITPKKWGQHTGAEWTVLAAEIEAIHGKRFDDTPWLQEYFDDRYWYKAAEHYDPKQLNRDRTQEPAGDCWSAQKATWRGALRRATWSFLRTRLCPRRCCAV